MLKGNTGSDNLISDLLMKLQKDLKLDADRRLPLEPEEVVKLEKVILLDKKILGEKFILWLHGQTQHGRELLAWVIFLGAISVGALAVLQLLHILHIIQKIH